MPAALAFPLQGRRYNWAYETDPEPYMNNRRMECGRGKGIGASNQFEAGGFIRSRAKFEWPNIQYHFLPVAINYAGTRRYRAAARPTTSPQTPRRATCRRHSQLARKTAAG